MIIRSPTGCWWNSKEFYIGGGRGGGFVRKFNIVHVDILDPLYQVQLTLNTTCVVRVNTRLLMVWSMIQRTGNIVTDMTGDFTLKCALD